MSARSRAYWVAVGLAGWAVVELLTLAFWLLNQASDVAVVLGVTVLAGGVILIPSVFRILRQLSQKGSHPNA